MKAAQLESIFMKNINKNRSNDSDDSSEFQKILKKYGKEAFEVN